MTVQKYSFVRRHGYHADADVGQFVHPCNESDDVIGFISRVYNDTIEVTLFVPTDMPLETRPGSKVISAKLTDDELEDDMTRVAYLNPNFMPQLGDLMKASE